MENSKIIKFKFERRAVVIGETGLCVECCKQLLAKGWELLAVVSDDQEVVNFCQKNNLKCNPASDLKDLTINEACILFSIINPNIIPKDFLQQKNIQLAINYHDSLLPFYAGNNSTTWAILNNEKTHGVTWHLIAEGIDEGDIVLQEKLTIDSDETANSLNLKCTEKSLELFSKLVNQIESGKVSLKAQDLSKKTYYGRSFIPHEYGIINTLHDNERDRYCRGLAFGEHYDNPVATVKFFINNEFIILDEYLGNRYSSQEKNNLFSNVSNIYGEPLPDSHFKNIDSIKSKIELLTDDEKILLSQLKQKERAIKIKLFKLLDYSQCAFDAPIQKEIEPAAFIKEFDLKKSLKDRQVLSILLMTIFKIFNKECLITCYQEAEGSNRLKSLLDKKVIIPLSKDLFNNSLDVFLDKVEKFFNSSVTMIKDFFYRYHLMNFLTDVGIYINTPVSNFPKAHRLLISVNNNKIKFYGLENDQAILNSLMSALIEVLNHFEDNYKKSLKANEINLLSSKQYQEIVYDWNNTNYPDINRSTFSEFIEQQAIEKPDGIAIQFEQEKLSYRELDKLTNQLARYIRKKYEGLTGASLEPNTLIGLYCDRSVEMVIGLIAIVKSGAAYVPIDPDYPESRVQYILNDTKAKLIVTQKQFVHALNRLKLNEESALILTDELDYQKEETQSLELARNPSQVLYVIYTSGTTGNPKGVIITHEAVMNYFANMDVLSAFNNEDVIDCSSSISFDATVQVLLYPLSMGKTVSLCRLKVKQEPSEYLRYLQENKVNVIKATPSYLNSLLSHMGSQSQALPSLSVLIVGGEAISKIDLLRWHEHYPQCRIMHHYGPTETTVGSLYHWVDFEKNQYPGQIPLGKPQCNTRCYVLDSEMNPLPIGVIGELYIGGLGLAKGYLNQAELTNKSFVPNPFMRPGEEAQGHSKLYKTGDQVRWTSKGELEYIGRKDFQVKLRGYRIELGEIEGQMLRYAGIKQACVLLRERGEIEKNQYLVGYYVSEGEIEEKELSAHLAQILPEYMLPSVYVKMDSFPLTVNGKLNRQAFPEAEFKLENTYVEPRNETEKKLCELWSRVLGIQKIGIQDDFFSIGGNSIIGIKLISLVNVYFKSQVSVRDIFIHRTIEQFALL
ncbi:MAG: amino acid adenylation domain-containing protein, partial [Proteobacteria bacterium]|nr:amino acid adenylation domain-containing protein [Pseudomonadota bacterium]